jgi:Zn-dependent peptidase ImmA (M78 family)/DNA-binding XRE family transcriptional regulator
MIGERINRARSAAGLSLKALGEIVGVSNNMIKKYEHGNSIPTSGMLIKISKALGVRNEYFFRPDHVTLTNVEYRKRSSTPAKVLKRIKADVLDQAERWQELANIWPSFPLPKFDKGDLAAKVTTLDDVDTLSQSLRAEWGLGENPIPDLIDTLESKGILVIITDVDESAKFDGLQATVSDQPVIVVSSNWPGDRQRFTIAHELGHLYLHGQLPADLDEEKACNRFAGSFLLPTRSIRSQMGERRHNIEIQELYMLKHEYGLSMSACLYRAKDVGIIEERTHTKIMIYFNKHHWRKKEPNDAYPKEQTYLFKQLVYRALGEGIVSESKAAELLGVPLMKFHNERKLEHVDAVASQ